MLTEPNGLILNFAIYTGSKDNLGGKGHASKVVLHLLEDKLNNRHSFYMDNFYNSYDYYHKSYSRKNILYWYTEDKYIKYTKRRSDCKT